VEANRETVTAAVTAAVKQQVLQQVLQAQGYTLEQYNASPALRTAVDAAVDAQMQTAAVQQTISDNVAAQMQALIDQTMQSTEVQSQIAAGQAQIEAGAKTLSALKQQLDTYNTFYQGIQAYTGGVDSAASSTKKSTPAWMRFWPARAAWQAARIRSGRKWTPRGRADQGRDRAEGRVEDACGRNAGPSMTKAFISC
jgi:DNA-binding protein H-NS